MNTAVLFGLRALMIVLMHGAGAEVWVMLMGYGR